MQHHIIEKMHVETRADNYTDAAKLQHQLGYWIHTNSFRRQLETLLDELVPNGESMKIDRVELQIDVENEQMFSSQFLKELRKAIQKKIKTGPRNSVQLVSREAFEERITAFFLKYGAVPSNTDRVMMDRIHEAIRQLPHGGDEKLAALVFKTAQAHLLVWERLYYMIGLSGIREFLLRRQKISVDFVEWMSGLEKPAAPQNKQGSAWKDSGKVAPGFKLWEKVLRLLTEGISQEDIKRILSGWATVEKNLPADFSGNKTSDRADDSGNGNGSSMDAVREFLTRKEMQQDFLSVSYAGMILIWVEFGLLVRKLGWVVDKAFRDAFAQQQAILLLHYLVTGSREARENELLLHKLFCAWPLYAPVDPGAFPDEAIQKVADELLEKFVSDWKKDKRFSTDWLRRHFFQRDGQLQERPDGNWELLVFRRTEDILVDIPTVVRYSWMKKILFIQW
jgi:hypothetical protein